MSITQLRIFLFTLLIFTIDAEIISVENKGISITGYYVIGKVGQNSIIPPISVIIQDQIISIDGCNIYDFLYEYNTSSGRIKIKIISQSKNDCKESQDSLILSALKKSQRAEKRDKAVVFFDSRNKQTFTMQQSVILNIPGSFQIVGAYIISKIHSKDIKLSDIPMIITGSRVVLGVCDTPELSFSYNKQSNECTIRNQDNEYKCQKQIHKDGLDLQILGILQQVNKLKKIPKGIVFLNENQTQLMELQQLSDSQGFREQYVQIQQIERYNNPQPFNYTPQQQSLDNP